MKTPIVLSLVLALTAAVAVPPASAAKKTSKGAPASDPAEAAMMAKWKEYAAPSEGHKILDKMVGNWDAATQMWTAPDAAPTESKGSSEFKSIFGGRFVEHVHHGTAMGQPFEGRGLIGYDNFKKAYESVWIDDMASGMLKFTGRYDPVSKTLTDTGEAVDCHTWTLKPVRAVTTFVDAKKMTFEVYSPAPDGKEFLSLKITYTRKP